MNQRAARGAEALASQSGRQNAKLRAQLQANIARYAGSEMFRAMRADIQHSGSNAFAVTGHGDEASAVTSDRDRGKPHDA